MKRLRVSLQPLHEGPIEIIGPAPNMGMINFLYSMGRIAIAKAKAGKESSDIYQLGMYVWIGQRSRDIHAKWMKTD